MRLEVERAAVAAACRRLADDGLVIGTSGNVSARSEDLIAITPTGARLAELDAEQVSVVDRAGELVDGELEPTSELALHLGVYDRYDAGAVVHTHAPASTALACVIDELPCVHYSMLLLGGSVRVAPYSTFGTPELAASVLDALEGKTAALMASHGAVTYADDLDSAVERTELLEWACEVYARASAVGEPAVLDAERQREVVQAAVERRYGEMRRAEGR
ncbi:MAG: class II aldolase/adducin family protein [Solirubrobacterales bacterium]